MSSNDDVKGASKQFYAALNSMLNGSAAQMDDIWSRNFAVTAMHPVGGREVGWDSVRESWEQVAQVSSDGQVQLGEQILEIAGDMAYELGVEKGQFKLADEQVNVESRVTNIYRRDADGWKIVHHHTDLSTAMLDVLGRIQARTKS